MAASERGVRISRLREFHSYVGYGYIDDKRRLIVTEAAKLFADKGVHATSLEEIAKRFGMTRSALYNYFSSKDRILEEILIVAHENACAALAQLAERRVDGANRLRALAIRYVNDTLSDFGRFLTIVEHSTLNTRCRRLMSKSHRVMLNGMISVIEAGIADGTLRPCRPKIAAFSIFGALNAVTRYFVPAGEFTRDQVTTETIEAVLYGVAVNPRELNSHAEQSAQEQS